MHTYKQKQADFIFYYNIIFEVSQFSRFIEDSFWF